ncbi:MAG: hypothetical protein CMJ18_02675 [Phycisphaeraceae bacterium]|nr:hypothetical protein [Phycisphaeraceae bacterium]
MTDKPLPKEPGRIGSTCRVVGRVGRIVHWTFTVLILLMFSLGLISITSDNRALQSVGSSCGWLHRMVPPESETASAMVHWYHVAAGWLGATPRDVVPPVANADPS